MIDRWSARDVRATFATRSRSKPFLALALSAPRMSIRRQTNEADLHRAIGGHDRCHASAGAMGAAAQPGVGPKCHLAGRAGQSIRADPVLAGPDPPRGC